MKYKLVITSLTQKEVAEALKYYVDKSPGTAKRFLDLVESSFDFLDVNPQHYCFFGDSQIVRSLSLKNFPYSIIFATKEDEVRVIAFHNNYRDPDYILNRI